MSAAKHYTEWSKEDKDALAKQRMEEMKKKNEELKRRHAEVEADREKAEQQNSSVTLAIKAKSPTLDVRFFDDTRNKESSYEDSHDVPRRNLYNSGSKDFRNSRQGAGPRKPPEKEFARGSNMSEKEREDYEKWKAERKKIDEDRIARHKVKREWDEDKVEQEPELRSLPSSKFYREPSWISKQDDWSQRRDFNQRGHFRGNDRTHFKNPRQNYESEDANWQDKPNKSFGRSGTKDSSFDKFGRASLSDDEDSRYNDRQRRFDSSNNYSSGFRKNQDGTSSQNFRTRGHGGFFQGSQNDCGKINSVARSNQNNSFSKNDPNPVRTSRGYNSSDNCFDRRNDGQGVNYKGRFRGNEDIHVNSKVPKQSSGTWSGDDSDSSRTKQSSSNWSDDDSTYRKTADDNTSANTDSVLSKSKPKQSSDTWSGDDSSASTKTSTKTLAQRNNSFPKSRKKPTGDTWSDNDSGDVKRHSKSSSSTCSKDCVSSGGAWSDVDDEGSNGKSRNDDDAWLDISDKNESSSSKYGKSRKWNEKQPPVNYPAGRGRKWPFEPSRQYSSKTGSSSYNDCDEQKSENRAIRLGTDDNLTVTISGGSNDIKGNRPFSQWGVKNSEPCYKNTERTSQVLNRSFSDPDRHQVKHDEPNHGFQQNSRNFRGRGSSLKRGSLSNTSFQKSNFGDAPQQKFRESSRGGTRGGQGGFRHSNNFSSGARRSGETVRYTEDHEQPNRNSKPHKNENLDEGWGDTGKENFAVHSEDIWLDAEDLENTNLSPEWTEDNTGNDQCLKAEEKTEDGWETENCGGSRLHPNDNRKSSDFTHNQTKEENQMDSDKNSEGIKQNNSEFWKSHENIVVDTKRNILEAEQSPLHVGNESHDDSSWVTTSGEEFEEELEGGEYIDDDESLHSSMQHYGGDTSSPEPAQNFVCSMTEFLNLAKTATARSTEFEQVHLIEKSKDVLDNTFCSSLKLGNPEVTESILLPVDNVSSNDDDNNSREVLSAHEFKLDDVIENCPHSDAIPSTIGGGQKFLSEGHVGESVDGQSSEANHCTNTEHASAADNKKTVPEMQGLPEQLVSSAVHSLVPTGENYKAFCSHEINLSHSESTHEKNVELEGQNTNSSSNHSKNGNLSLCSETLCNSSVANNFSDFTSSENLDKNCIPADSPEQAESILNETTSSVNVTCSNTSEELTESNEVQNSTVHNVDTEANSVRITSSDSISCADNHKLTVVSPKENSFSEPMCNTQEDRSESEIGNPVISASELGVGGKTEMGNGTAFATEQTDINDSIVHSKMPIPLGENLDVNEGLPANDSYVMSDQHDRKEHVN